MHITGLQYLLYKGQCTTERERNRERDRDGKEGRKEEKKTGRERGREVRNVPMQETLVEHLLYTSLCSMIKTDSVPALK